MKIVRVQLKERGYEIFVGYPLDQVGGLMVRHHPARKALIVTNPDVGSRYAGSVTESLRAAGLDPMLVTVPDGEEHKSIQDAVRLFTACAKHGIERGSIIFALGGGVIGDLAGYVAATYLRGVSYVQIPTSLLAQVDASVGGKVAVNLHEGKNLVGAFYQPLFVQVDLAVLGSLPEREFTSGLAEVIKYGVIADVNFFKYLEGNLDAIRALDPAALEYVVVQSVQFKARIVEQDERERSLRMYLNFGHTIGHALEAATRYTVYKHGEAVAIGMVCAARIAHELRMLEVSYVQRIEQLVQRAGLPARLDVPLAGSRPEPISVKDLLPYLGRDKKVSAEKVRFVLPQNLGRVVVKDLASLDVVERVLQEQGACP